MFRVRKGKLVLLAAAASGALPSLGLAQNASWTFNGNSAAWTNNWLLNTNWLPNTIPNSQTANVTFPANAVAGGAGTVQLNTGTVTAAQINFNSSGGNGYTILGGGTINMATGVNTGGTINVAASSTATISTGITAPSNGFLTKIGTGTLILNGTSTFGGGGIQVNAGIIDVQNGNALNGVGIVSSGTTGSIQMDGLSTPGAIVAGLGNGTTIWAGSGNNTWNGDMFLVTSNGGVGAAAGSTLTIAGNINDGLDPTVNGFQKNGPGTVKISKVALAGGLTINDGKMVLTAGPNPGSNSNASSVGTGSTSPGAVTIGATGLLDITNNKMIINYGTLASPIQTIKGYVNSGRGTGTWNGTSGITSSTAGAGTTNFFAVGYGDGAAGVIPGLTAGKVEIAFTVMGDINLDGHVNLTDYTRLLTHFGLNAPNNLWTDGDLNGDGLVNLADYTLLLTHFGNVLAGGTLPAPLPADLAVAAVPEPAMTSLLGLGALGILARRNRRRAGLSLDK